MAQLEEDSLLMPKTDQNDAHERCTRLLLESEPVMLRSILVVVASRADAREIVQESHTPIALGNSYAGNVELSLARSPNYRFAC